MATVRWDGGLADGGMLSNGFFDSNTCARLCSCVSTTNACQLVSDAGLVECRVQCVGGRAPPGLAQISRVDESPGSWLSRMAELEAAAVHAFLHLARELDAHGLPLLASAARSAAGDEVLHAQKAARLAVRRGWSPQPLVIRASPIRSLAELAIDNAGEGCGRELFGAALNQHQARAASDNEVAIAMGEIAGDEARHAAFSLALSEQLTPRLTLADRRRAREAQAMVLTTLSAEDVPVRSRHTLGLMSRAQAVTTARRLLDANRV